MQFLAIRYISRFLILVVPVTGKGVQLAPWSLLEVLLCRYILPGKRISTWVEVARTFGIKYANNWVLFWSHSSFAHWNIFIFLLFVFFFFVKWFLGFFFLLLFCLYFSPFYSPLIVLNLRFAYWLSEYNLCFRRLIQKTPFISLFPNFSSVYWKPLHEMEAVFCIRCLCHLSTKFMHIGWELWLWLLRHISLHFSFS